MFEQHFPKKSDTWKVKFLLSVVIIAFMVGCRQVKSSLPSVTGSVYEVLVVMEAGQWKSSTGIAVRELFGQNMAGLPQPEPMMDIIPCASQTFTNRFKSSRNIFIVEISEKYSQPKVIYSIDKWAHPQAVVKIVAPNNNSFVNIITQYGDKILNFFIVQERIRLMKYNSNHVNAAAQKDIEKIFDMRIDIPGEFQKSSQRTDFYWITNDNVKIRKDIVIYSFPVKDSTGITLEYLLEKRDSVMKAHLPGEVEGSYMGTEYRYLPPVFKKFSLKGSYCAEIRGLWKMINGAAMGGPFYSQTRWDETSGRAITIEGFVFAPGEKKRNAIRQLEAIIYSVQLHKKSE